MPTYSGEWKGPNRWKVDWVDTTKVSDIAKNDWLTFQGDGDGIGTDDILDNSSGTSWGSRCHFDSGFDRVVLANSSIGQATIVRTPGTPSTLTCKKGGPGDEVWTAVDQNPPRP